MIPSWQKRRSAFNHDWLARKYIGRIASFLNILAGEVSDPDLEAQFIQDMLPQWEQRRNEAYRLPTDFLEDMSPQQLFQQEPLCQCDVETMAWLPDLINQLWQARYTVDDYMEQVRSAVAEADTSYRDIQQALSNLPDKTTKTLQNLRPKFEAFHKHCKALNAAISALPHEIRVI